MYLLKNLNITPNFQIFISLITGFSWFFSGLVCGLNVLWRYFVHQKKFPLFIHIPFCKENVWLASVVNFSGKISIPRLVIASHNLNGSKIGSWTVCRFCKVNKRLQTFEQTTTNKKIAYGLHNMFYFERKKTFMQYLYCICLSASVYCNVHFF